MTTEAWGRWLGREAGKLGGSYGLFQGLAGLSASVKKEKGRKQKKNGGKKQAEGKPEKSTKIFKKRARESQLTIYTTKAGFQALFSRYINDHLDVVQAYSLEREGGDWRHPVDSAAREKRRGSTGGKAARSYNELCQLDTWSNLAKPQD